MSIAGLTEDEITIWKQREIIADLVWALKLARPYVKDAMRTYDAKMAIDAFKKLDDALIRAEAEGK